MFFHRVDVFIPISPFGCPEREVFRALDLQTPHRVRVFPLRTPPLEPVYPTGDAVPLLPDGTVDFDRMADLVVVPTENRIETIARTRNEVHPFLRAMTDPADFIFFLDSDVVVQPGAFGPLLAALWEDPLLAAIGLDYNNESRAARTGGQDLFQSVLESGDPRISDAPQEDDPHVAMGAVMWRRKALETVTFRYSEKPRNANDEPLHYKCECQNACDDLRAGGWAIRYHPSVWAEHASARPSPPRGVDSAFALSRHMADVEAEAQEDAAG